MKPHDDDMLHTNAPPSLPAWLIHKLQTEEEGRSSPMYAGLSLGQPSVTSAQRTQSDESPWHRIVIPL